MSKAKKSADVRAESTTADGETSNSDRGHLEVRIGTVLVARTPESIARSLRYTLARTSSIEERIIGVTSAHRGEGTTSVSRSMAAIIGQDRRVSVCWLDLNWWKADDPITAQLFPRTVADFVNGASTFAQLPVPTSIPRLSMISAGSMPAGSRSMAAHSDQVATLLRVLEDNFEYVVVDLPPVLATADSITLAQLTSGFHLVVGRRRTDISEVRTCIEEMRPAKCLSVILNDAGRRGLSKRRRARRG